MNKKFVYQAGNNKKVMILFVYWNQLKLLFKHIYSIVLGAWGILSALSLIVIILFTGLFVWTQENGILDAGWACFTKCYCQFRNFFPLFHPFGWAAEMASFGALIVSPIYFRLPEMDNGRTIHPAGGIRGMAYVPFPFILCYFHCFP